MSGLQRLALMVVVVAVGLTVFFVVDRGRRAPEQTDVPYEMVDSLHEPIVPTEVPANIREGERSRRATRPTDGLNYDAVLEGRNHEGTLTRAKPAEPMSLLYNVDGSPRELKSWPPVSNEASVA